MLLEAGVHLAADGRLIEAKFASTGIGVDGRGPGGREAGRYPVA